MGYPGVSGQGAVGLDGSKFLGLLGILLQGDANSQLLAFAHRGDAKVGEIIQELPFTGEVPPDRKFDVGERVPDGEKPVSQDVNGEQVRIGNALCPGAGNRVRTCKSYGLASGMTKVSLVFQFWDPGRVKHDIE
jgi:hypothetical protein